MNPLRLGCLASHGGTNLQAIIDACKSGTLDAEVRVVISNNSSSTALGRARNEGIPGYHLSGVTHPGPEELARAIHETLKSHDVDVVMLVGYMKKLGLAVLDGYPVRILNTHPALLPGFGGKGMYGQRVHEAVLEAGDRVTGVTVHLVDAEYDRGPIVAQCEVPVLDGDSVETLSVRVLEQEHAFLVETLGMISRGEIDLDALGAS
jgi:phosphoribosylglycinamide formyltransferase-1